MKNEDELMIALDMIKTYSDASKIHREQLNDAIQKIENVRMDLIRASRDQAQETVAKELALPMAEFKKSTDKFWSDSVKIINALDQQVENNKWKHTMIFSMSAAVIFGMSMLGIFMWLPSIDEIKSRRASIAYLEPKVEELRAKYNADFSTCGGKACVRVETKGCYANKGTNVYDLCILK